MYSSQSEASPSSPSASRRGHYPNPGFLGSSSHVAIFDQLFPGQDGTSTATTQAITARPSVEPYSADLLTTIRQLADGLGQFLRPNELSAMQSLVSFWHSKGVNLALAEPFVASCARASNFLSSVPEEGWQLSLSRRLLENTARPLAFDQTSTLQNYTAQFVGDDSRVETLGIFLTATLRASMDVSFFPSLYSTEPQRRQFQDALTRLSGLCLDLCFSLDCLNDLQLLFQYENFILHSYTNGDQSERPRQQCACWPPGLTQMCRLSTVAQIGRCDIVNTCTWLSRGSQWQSRYSRIHLRISQSCICPNILRRQERLFVSGQAAEDEQKILPFPASRGRSGSRQQRDRA